MGEAKTCKTCKWANLPRTVNGRTRSDWVGACEWPMPEIAMPWCITTHYLNTGKKIEPYRTHITANSGTKCPTWEAQ